VVNSVSVGALKRPEMGAEAPLRGASAPCVVELVGVFSNLWVGSSSPSPPCQEGHVGSYQQR